MIALIEASRAGLFARGHWANNILAGLVVGIVALPLAMAFAIASGAKPEQGLYTAIIAALAVSLFGGSRLQIAGPTGAFIVILADITARHGIDGLQIATFMAGLMLLAMGLARLGTVIKYIPDPVVVGFTCGIGIIIFVGQWASFGGLPAAPAHALFHEKLWALIASFPKAHLPTLALGAATLFIMLIAPLITRAIPAPLIAMLAATLAQAGLQIQGIATIGSAFGGIPQSLPAPQLPELSFARVLHLLGPAFAIALLGAIESLLSALVADGMSGTRHNSNQELIGQGLANILAPIFGGFAATGAIARTATNVRAGATSPLAGVTNSLFLIAVVLVCAPLAADIPLAALAAILFVVAWNMAELPRLFSLIKRAPGPDVAVLLITLGLTVFADLVVAVNVGVVLAALMFMRRMARAVRIEEQGAEQLAPALGADQALPPRTLVFAIDGPFFFGVAEKLESTLEHIHAHTDNLILRLSRVPFIDATAIAALDQLIEDCTKGNTRLLLCELPANVRAKLERAGVLLRLGGENIHSTLEACVHEIGSPQIKKPGSAER